MGGGPSEPSGSDDSASDSSFNTPTETSTDTESSDSSVEEPPEINRNQRSQSRRVSSRRSTGGNERHRDKQRRTRRNPHGSPSDSSDSSGRDDRSHHSRRSHHSNWSGHRDDKSSRRGTRSERTRYNSRRNSRFPSDESEDEGTDWDDDDGIAHEIAYENEVLRRIRKMIRDRVGYELETQVDTKSIRISAPDKYSGEDDIEKFDVWLTGLLRWMRVHNVTGPNKDTLRVDLCSTTLTSLAATWYTDNVEAWNRKVKNWTFERLICELYKRFIHEVTAQNAATSYKKTRYSRVKGALAYYNDLRRHASRMVQPPDKYSLKRKFIEGLPEDLVENLLKSRRVSAEHTPLNRLLEEVKAMESSIQAYQNYKSDRQERSTTQKSTPATSTPQTTTTRRPRVVRFVKKYQTRSTGQNFQRNQSNTRDVTNNTFPSNNNADKGARTNNSRPNYMNTKGNSSGNTQNKTASKDVECYNCGEKGHYSTNCPKRPRVFAAQVIDEDAEPSSAPDRDHNDDADEEQGDPSPETEGEPIGSQYDSDQEGYPVDDYIEIGDTSEAHITDDDHTNDVSDGASTLVDSVNTSVELIDIPSDMYPNELLHALSDKIRIEIYYRRKREENPAWVPLAVPENERKTPRYMPPPQQLIELGYSTQDDMDDTDWLERSATRRPDEFEELTGYRAPIELTCEVCSVCTPETQTITFLGDDGVIYDRTITRCQNNPQSVSIRAMTDIPEPTHAYRASIRRPVGSIRHPEREDGEQLCLAAYIDVNGTKAYTLFDSGSTTDAISPDFTRVARLPILELENPVTLQLGCSGSRSKINYGSEANVKFASITSDTYLDVANLDKYDSILGTPFMRKHGIILDFETQEIVIRGKLRIPALPEGEGAATAGRSPRNGKHH